MSASSPAVHSSCLPSSTCKSGARQASAPNVALPYSPFRRFSPGGCALSWSSAVANPTFFHVPPRRRNRNTKPVFVVKGSSPTFDVDEERKRHVLQPAVPGSGRVSKGRVSWSPDGKATILWGAQKQQDNVSLSDKSRAQEGKASDESGKFSSQHEPSVPSVGDHENSSSWQNQQSASPTIQKRSSSPTRQENELFNPSSASRLLLGSHAFKQATEIDVRGAPILPVKGAGTLITHNEYTQFQGRAHTHEKDTPQVGSVFTSKLEEILNDFRTTKQKHGEDPFKGGAAPVGPLSLTSKVFRKGNDVNSERNFSRKGFERPRYGGFINETAADDVEVSEESSAVTRGHQIIPCEGRSFTMGQQDTRGNNDFRTRQKRDDAWRERTKQKHGDDPFKGGAAPVGPLSLTSKVFRKGNDVNSELNFSRKGFQRPRYGGFINETAADDVEVSEESSAVTRGHQIIPCEGRSFTMGQQDTRGNNDKDYEPLKPVGSPPAPWGVRRGRLPLSPIPSPITKGSSNFVERRSAKSNHLQYNSSNSFFESKTGVWGTDNKKNLIRRRTERPYTSRMSKSAHAQKSTDHNLVVNAEDRVDIASPITSDSEDGGSFSTQSDKAEEQKQASSEGFNTGGRELLTKNRKATWHSYSIPSLPFEVQFSYSETPNAPVIRYREKPYSPFGPMTLSRPWTGGPPRKKSKKNLPLFDSFDPPPKGKKGVKPVQDPGPYPKGQGPKRAKSREEVLGQPLNAQEIAELVDSCQNENRQMNLGRDGLTHNMLDLIHSHWKRRRVIKVRCLGVPTVDMDNVCFHLEDKTGGKILYRSGGVVYLFRGRNYNYRDRPEIPLMLWRPIAPVYPKLIKRAPEGLTEKEADQLRVLGKKIEPLCTLSKNGVYINLVEDVRAAFKLDEIVRIDCTGLNPSDYKKLGAKLKDLVPCVLLSFNDEQILMWKGKETPTTDVDYLKGFEAAEGFSEESLVSPVESTSISMSEEGENATVAIESSSTSSLSSDNCHFSDVTRATSAIGHQEQSLEVSKTRDFKAGSEVNNLLHLVLGAQDELDLNEAPDIRPRIENMMPYSTSGHLEGGKALPDATCIEKGEYRESRHLAEDQRKAATLCAGFALASSSLGIEENVESTLKACVVVLVDDLWDQAITSGIAIQLDDVEIDNEIVLRKARELADSVPAGEVYTRKLMRTLEVKTKKPFSPENEMHKHLKKIRRERLEKKLLKRSFRIRSADVPEELPEDGPQNSGKGMVGGFSPSGKAPSASGSILYHCWLLA
ncbi:hypothetical protein GOP47_0004772 [Adiantum capillus-veneris]|uniref:CRM domain-containing protein n=1 Tax=Adiantum capillus-veneris TaxID=13818 RepID=A0A9D4V4W2_ADICA|nr:hypothetical protein GOP47_0004772 [Adiantum capillus-veneris]